MTTKKGIVDPWRIVDPVRPAPREARKDLGQDVDADLRMARQYTFRCSGGGLHVKSRNLNTDADALAAIVACLFDLMALPNIKTLLTNERIGLRLGKRSWNLPKEGTAGANLETDNARLIFVNNTLDEGMKRLVRLFALAKKKDAETKFLQKHGVTPLLR
jgi:hypothetical protein